MIILASASPRRRELLARITDQFMVIASDADEDVDSSDPEVVVRTLSERKAETVAKSQPEALVIGCDTVVYIDGEILGKPRNIDDAERMMRLLAGRRHLVYTGVAMQRNGEHLYERDATEVFFTPIDDAELEIYLRTADVLDKAGAYAIQGAASKFIRGICGSCSGVMGLPVELTYHMLKQFDAQF